MKVIVVDNSETTRTVAKNCLGNLGVEKVYEAADGATAMEIINSEPVDIVFSEWNMPKMTGIELLAEVRKQFAELPFIMITAECSKENVLEAMKHGVTDYLSKPFSPATLSQKLKKWVECVSA